MTMYPNRLGLMIAVPLSGNPVVPDWAFAFHQLNPPMNYNVEYSLVRGKEVGEARNHFMKLAMEKKCKYLFFVDEDVTPPPHSLRQLIYHLEHFPKYAVAAGIYCHKSPPSMPMVFRGNGAGPFWDWKAGEVFECSGVGMGCALLRVDAFRDIEQPWFKTVDNAEAFKEGINQGEMWTEDLYACDKLTKAGWKILADGGILPGHWDLRSGQAYYLPPTSKPLQRPGVKLGKKRIIDLGSGHPEESYKTDEGEVLRVDIREDAKPDYRCDLRVLPFGSGEFDIVYSSHTLEHFDRKDIPAVLDEWVRLLKPDGELRLLLPNIKWAAQHIMNDEIDIDVMNVLYGAQTYDENFHRCGFTPQIIEQLLAERGFKKFVWDHNNYHMFCRAWKIPPAESIAPAAPIVRAEQLAAIETLKIEDLPKELTESSKAEPEKVADQEMHEEMKAAVEG
jgi:predicted SAM-dependent methyltransferase